MKWKTFFIDFKEQSFGEEKRKFDKNGRRKL